MKSIGVRMEDPARLMYLPCAITMIGAALSLAWLAHLAPWWIGAIGLLCDCLDGYVARKLGVTSEFGSLLDWSSDMLLWGIGVFQFFPNEKAILVILASLPIQIRLRTVDVHFCGRALVFLLLFVREALG